MSCDPIKLMASTLSINPYVYSYNNPISFSDASGLKVKGQDNPSKGGQSCDVGDDPSFLSNFTGFVEGQVEILAEEIAETYDETVDVFMPDIPSDNGQGGYGSAFADAKANSGLAESLTSSTGNDVVQYEKKMIKPHKNRDIHRKKMYEASREHETSFLHEPYSGITFQFSGNWLIPSRSLTINANDEIESDYELGIFSDWRQGTIATPSVNFEAKFGDTQNGYPLGGSICFIQGMYYTGTGAWSIGLAADGFDVIGVIIPPLWGLMFVPTPTISFGAINDIYNDIANQGDE